MGGSLFDSIVNFGTALKYFRVLGITLCIE